MRTINVMKPSDAALDTEVFFEVTAHALAEELFPTVTVLWQGRIRVFFLQRDDIRISLLLGIVNAGGGRIKKALYPTIPCCEQHMRIGEHAEHTQGPIVFDK